MIIRIAELKKELLQLADLIAAAALKYQNPTSDEISERKAKEEFGTAWINYHTARNHIEWWRRGAFKNSPKVTSRAALLALREAEKLIGETVLQELSQDD